jgi:hypothetical protein
LDATAIWTSVVNNLPAILASLGTLLGIWATSRKLRLGQERAEIIAANYRASSDSKLDIIHGLVNSTLGTSLRFSALLARRVADLTKDPRDLGVALAATKAADEHDQRQLQVDSKKV